MPQAVAGPAMAGELVVADPAVGREVAGVEQMRIAEARLHRRRGRRGPQIAEGAAEPDVGLVVFAWTRTYCRRTRAIC